MTFEILKGLQEKVIERNSSALTDIFIKALYSFLLVKIIFLIPVITEITVYHHYRAQGVIKKILCSLSYAGQEFPVTFLVITCLVLLYFLFRKPTVYTIALVWWLSFNISKLSEPVNNGSDYVLNMLLLMSVPLGVSLKGNLAVHNISIKSYTTLLIQLNIALIYFVSGYDKLLNETWQTGQAVAHIIALKYYAPLLGSILDNPTSHYLLAWCVIIFEMAFPILIWFNRLRYIVLGIGTLFHIGIIYFLNLPDFGILMILSYTIFLTGKSSTSLQDKPGLFKI